MQHNEKKFCILILRSSVCLHVKSLFRKELLNSAVPRAQSVDLNPCGLSVSRNLCSCLSDVIGMRLR